MVQSKNEVIIDLARSITVNEKTALNKSRAIHAWVVNNISYDQNAAEKRIRGQEEDSKQDALYVLTSKIAVCEGYADLIAALHRAIGIPATVTVGKFYYFSAKLYPTLKRINHLPDVKSVNYYHAWNEILIDGKWVPMDSTSDSGYSGGSTWKRSTTLDEEFFNPDIDYFNATHLKTEIFDR
jgi:transglutaminase-like putative cysteine protease